MESRFPRTFTSSSGGGWTIFYKLSYISADPLVHRLLEVETKLDECHAVVMSVIKDGNFALASMMFTRMDEVYRPKDELELENFAYPRLGQIDSILRMNRTIKDVYVRRENAKDELSPQQVTNYIMRDLPLFTRGGMHVVKYVQTESGKLLLIDY